MMKAESLQRLVNGSGAIRQGHFVLDSGLHARRYLQATDLLGDPSTAEPLLAGLSELCADLSPVAVVGANEAGSVIAWYVATALQAEPHFARRDGSSYHVIGGRSLPGGPVLIVDDVTTTGGTARKLVEATARAGGAPCGVGILATKSLHDFDLGVPTRTLVALTGMDAVAPEHCPACQAGLGLTPR